MAETEAAPTEGANPELLDDWISRRILAPRSIAHQCCLQKKLCLTAISCAVLSPRSASSAIVALNLSEKLRLLVICVSCRQCWIHLTTLSSFAGPLQLGQASLTRTIVSVNGNRLEAHPQIMLCHLQLPPEIIDRFPATRPHDGSDVISGAEQILGRADAE